MNKLLLLIFNTLILSGCAVSSSTYGPDGNKAYTINCSGAALDWGACYGKAGDICKEKGYNIISQNSDENSWNPSIYKN